VSGPTSGVAGTSTDRGRRRRAAVLDAAEALFVEHGFHAVSVDDLGTSAGISGPGLYRHFASKDALLMAVLDRIWERLAPSVAAAEAAPATEALELLLAAHLELALDRPAALELLLRELVHLPADYRELARRHHRRYVDAWAQAITGVRTDLDVDEARLLALAVHGLLDSTTRTTRLPPVGVTRDVHRQLLEGAARRVLAATG
jgi:AcrR family transcriptional regulator